MYNLPGVEGVNEIVVNEVIENKSNLYIYDKSNKVMNKKA